MYPTSLVALERFQVGQYDFYKRVKNTSFRCNGRCSGLYKQYFFLKFLRKSWELIVA